METIVELLSQAMASFADYREEFYQKDYDIGMQRLHLAQKMINKQCVCSEAPQRIDPCASEGCD